jgi:hypothetical protein
MPRRGQYSPAADKRLIRRVGFRAFGLEALSRWTDRFAFKTFHSDIAVVRSAD